MPLRTDYSTFRHPVDPAANLSKVLAGLQGQLSQYEQQKLAEQRQAALLEQQAAENARAERSLSLKESEYARAKAQDEALGKALLGLNLNNVGQEVVPAGTKKEVTPGVLTTGEQEGLATGKQNLEKLLANLEAEKVQASTEAEAGKKKPLTGSRRLAAEKRGEVIDEGPTFLSRGLGKDAPYMQPVYDAAGRKVDEASDIFSSMFTDHEVSTSTDTAVSPTTGLVIPKEALPIDDRIAAVKKDLSVYDTQTKQAKVNIAKERAKTNIIEIPESTKDKTLSKAEWKSREKKKVKDLGLGGAALSKYLKEVDSAGELLYPKGEKITGTISITSADGKRSTSVPYARAQQFLDAGWKIGKPVKNSGKTGGDVVSQFATAMYTAFPEDPAAVETYITKHEKDLKTMSKDNIKALVAELKAKVGQESAWDITNWAPTALGGGTDVRDVLLP